MSDYKFIRLNKSDKSEKKYYALFKNIKIIKRKEFILVLLE